jgi:cytochrome-b5 reductase
LRSLCAVTPMLQALHALLGSAGDATEVAMLYGSQTSSDVLARGTLDAWALSSQGRFKVTHGERTLNGRWALSVG